MGAPPCALLLFASTFFLEVGRALTPEIHNIAGIEMKIDTANKDPALSVTVPDGSPGDRSFKILLPEHVTLRPHGQIEVQHLYIYNHVQRHTPMEVGCSRYDRFGQFTSRRAAGGRGILFRLGFVIAVTATHGAAVTSHFQRSSTSPPGRTYVHPRFGLSLPAPGAAAAYGWSGRYLAPHRSHSGDLCTGGTYRYSLSRRRRVHSVRGGGASFRAIRTLGAHSCCRMCPGPLPHGAHARYE